MEITEFRSLFLYLKAKLAILLQSATQDDFTKCLQGD